MLPGGRTHAVHIVCIGPKRLFYLDLSASIKFSLAMLSAVRPRGWP
jgi:hypothetical protein